MMFKANIYSQLGANNHSKHTREENDFYATDPIAVEKFLEQINKDGVKFSDGIWECATGQNHIANVLKNHGYKVYKSDIVDRCGSIDSIIDFLETDINPVPKYDILTNPPYKTGLAFVKKALSLLKEDGQRAIFFLKIQFLEGKSRYSFFQENPPKYVYVHSSRMNCVRGGRFEEYQSSAVCYAWYVFEKGFKGDTIIRWIK